RLAKMSGIGCSSKTPAYFVDSAHGFNGVHGRMPALTTGAKLADRDLIVLGVSGDGDTASIGLGQFMHLIRRNLDCTYIVEDNGTYGLTKGQFSATADVGSVQKRGTVNPYDEEVQVDYEPGTTTDVRLHDGSHLVLRKLHELDHDPTDRAAALKVVEDGRRTGQLVTGLLYVSPEAEDFSTRENLPEQPLRDLGED